jgi:hypothetical protein
MPLLDYTDFERQANATLSDPDGRALADTIANSILAWSAKYCNRLGWAKTTYSEYFSPDRYLDTFYVSALPLDTTQTTSVATYNANTNAYDAYILTVRANAQGRVKTQTALIWGDEAVKVSYTGGYDALPDDLKQALTELLVQKVHDSINGGMTVSSVKAIDYQETYDLSGADIPADTMEVLDSYKLPVVF